MRELNTTSYYGDREQQARRLAERAVDPDIAAIHREMAERYASLKSLTAQKNITA